MNNVSIQKASELPLSVRSALEQLLGRRIEADEEISIAATPPQEIAPLHSRAILAEKLEALLDRRAAKVSDVSDEELDAAIDEAAQGVRRNGE